MREPSDAADRKPAELDAEDQDEHDAEPIDRRALTEQREEPREHVERRVATYRGDDARRNRNDHRERQGGERQLGRSRNAFQREAQRGLAVAQRVAEVTVECVPRERAELHPERPVEPFGVTELRDLRGRRFERHHDRCRIAAQVQDDEDRHRDAGDDPHRSEGPA